MFQEQDKQKKAIKTNCFYFNKLEESLVKNEPILNCLLDTV